VKVLRMLLDEVKQYVEGLTPEMEAVLILEEVFGTTDA